MAKFTNTGQQAVCWKKIYSKQTGGGKAPKPMSNETDQKVEMMKNCSSFVGLNDCESSLIIVTSEGDTSTEKRANLHESTGRINQKKIPFIVEGTNNIGAARLFLLEVARQEIVDGLEYMNDYLQGTLVSSSNTCYPYKSYIKSLLCYGQDAKATQLTSMLFYKDRSGHMDSLTTNTGAYERRKFISSSKSVDLQGPLYHELFQKD
ncbi:unnamed protein product [Mytilus coruscus]|uniref:Uncharacterized protein n=1 Tax=Mytilus coruscus TaxID=42192 RepID=A0A6J7ZWN0_MYTCO|nr:unnamed protein product [Mytilus coruscus]